MNCKKCGKQINSTSKFCPYCGESITDNSFLSKTQKIIIISLLSVIIVFLSIILFLPDKYFKKDDTRTIMIYIVGSDLETDAGIVTYDLSVIDPAKIDLTKTNILLYTGGTTKWQNFISNEENQIYILKENGFEKIESQSQLNMGDPDTLTNFMKYCYDNYKTSRYDLVLYDHGGAIDGAIYDDFTDDNLSLEDMETALKNSPFNKNNKLEAVLFRTCLNGTIEIANVFNDYSEYLIASEETSWGSPYTDVLGFLNDLIPEDNGLEFGKKFVESYDEQMKILNRTGDIVQTYSVIDLTKIDDLNAKLDSYIKSLDINKNYKNIVQIRSSIYQYGVSGNDGSYDMIDLYEFIDKTSKYATEDASDLLKIIEETVKYNSSNRNDAHGLSIYFPFNGVKNAKAYFLRVYNNLDYSNEYKNFIETFNSMQQSPDGYTFSFSNNKLTSSASNNSFSITLTNEQLNTFSAGLFAIFEKDPEHPNYYKPIFSSDDTTLENNVLKANINNKMLKIKDDDGKEYYVLTYYRKNGNITRRVGGFLYKKDSKIFDEGYMNSVDFIISDDKGTPFISAAKLISKNDRINGTLLNLEDYYDLEITSNSFGILDSKGNVIDDWEASPVVTGYSTNLNEIELKNSGLDKGDNYYGLFILKDIYGNSSYSKLVKIGE